MLPDFRLYTKLSGVAKTENAVCTVQAQKQNTDSWGRTGGPEKNSIQWSCMDVKVGL